MSKIKIMSLPAVIAVALATPAATHAYSPDYYTGKSLLSEGTWVKVRINETGMQQITTDELKAMGFDNPEAVAVYGYGNSLLAPQTYSADLPDDLVPVATTVANGKLLFFGEADENLRLVYSNTLGGKTANAARNHYADFGCYFLTDSRQPLTVETMPYAEGTGDVLTHAMAIKYVNDDKVHPGGVGAYLFDEDFSSSKTHSVSFTLPGLTTDGNETTSVSGYLGMGTENLMTTFPVTFEGTTSVLRAENGAPGEHTYRTKTFDVQSVVTPTADGMYTLSFDMTSLTSLWFAGVESFSVVYPCSTDFTGVPQARIHFPNLTSGNTVEVSGNSTIHVWDISAATKPVELTATPTGESGKLRFSPQRDFTLNTTNTAPAYIVFDPSLELNSVESLGNVAPQNLHGEKTPRMLIITAPAFRSQAEELADIHRQYNGIEVLVAEPEQIYNEFSSGTPNLAGLRRFIKMFYDRDPQTFRSVVLFGPALADNRYNGFTGSDPRQTYLPIFSTLAREYSGSAIQAYSTDATLAMMNDNFSAEFTSHQYNDLDIAIGRIPASNTAEADNYLAKVRNYLANPIENPRKTALLLADYGDPVDTESGKLPGHQTASEELASTIESLSPSTTIIRAYHNLYPQISMLRETIGSYLTDGVGYMAYSGHADGKQIGGATMWSYNLAEATDYVFCPFITLATCHTLPIDQAVDCLGHELIMKRNGGAAGLVAACRAVYMNSNQLVNLGMGEAFYTAADNATFGDVFRTGRNLAIKKANTTPSLSEKQRLTHRLNTLCYNFVGDPELPLFAPGLTAALTTSGDTDIQANGLSVDPYTSTPVDGKIFNAQGETDATFNGHAVIAVYDSPRKVKTLYNSTTNPSTELTLDENLLAEFEVPVVNGEFSAELMVAPGTYANGTNRISISAITDDGTRRAFGSTRNVTFTTYDPSKNPAEFPAPRITEMYVNNPTTANGAVIYGDATLYAVIESEGAPLLKAVSGIGGGLRLNLDDNTTLNGVASYLSLNEDGTSSLAYPLTGLEAGTHTLTLRVENTAGSKDFRSISFTVSDEAFESALRVDTRMARSEAVISLDHNHSSTPASRLVITDVKGNALRSFDNVSFPFAWDLTNADGMRVAPGIYHATAYLKGEGANSVAEKADIVVGTAD